MTKSLALEAREALHVVPGGSSRTAPGGFLVFGALLVDESRMASFAAAIGDDIGNLSDCDLIAAAAQHGIHLIANIILEVIAASSFNARESGMRTISGQARTIARQRRPPLRAVDGATIPLLVPVAKRLVVVLARELGALEEGREDADLGAVVGLFPRISTGQRYRAALTTRPPKITVTQYRNRYHRLIKAVDAVSG